MSKPVAITASLSCASMSSLLRRTAVMANVVASILHIHITQGRITAGFQIASHKGCFGARALHCVSGSRLSDHLIPILDAKVKADA